MKSIHILLVEDNEGDILLTTEALEESRIINSVSSVRNGSDAIDFVLGNGKFVNRIPPDLILLDINLPMKNGHEVLEMVKSNPDYAHIPVIMLTTSSAESDILLSYKHHANCYITKPIEVNDFIGAVTSIENFWLNIVTLPHTRKHA